MQIDTTTRAGRMLDGLIQADNPKAKMLLTVDVAGQRAYHQEFRVKAWSGRDGTRMLTFDLHDGDWAAGQMPTKVMHVNTSTGQATPARGYSDQLVLWMAQAALRYAATGAAPAPSNGTVQVQEQEHCGCCGRRLTHPVSIGLGIGPECAKRVGLEHHYGGSQVAATRGSQAAAAPTEDTPSYEALTAAAIIALQREEQRLTRLYAEAHSREDYGYAQQLADQLDECRGQRSGMQAELYAVVGGSR